MVCLWCWVCPTPYLALNVLLWYIVLATLSWAVGRYRAPGFEVKGKHVLVTGGSEGLGLATALKLAKKGAKSVTIMSRNQGKLDKAKATIKAAVPDITVTTVSADVSKFDAVEKGVEKAVEANGPVDVLVCCAGLATPGYFLEQDVSVFHKMMDVNYFGCVHAAKAVGPSMASRRTGTIVLTGSALSLSSFIGYTQYCASKYAMRGLAEGLRHEFLSYGVRVCAFYPSTMKTAGYEEEEKTKPPETKKIEEGDSLTSTPAESAQRLIDGVASGAFATVESLDQTLLYSPIVPRANALLELPFATLGPLIGYFYGLYFDSSSIIDRKKSWPHTKKED